MKQCRCRLGCGGADGSAAPLLLVCVSRPGRGGGGRTANKSKDAAQGGGGAASEAPAAGMARDYDYLFKLLIIGDSGKPRLGLQDGK